MGEFFFQEYPCDIIRLLAVPEGQTTNEHKQSDVDSWAGDRIICIGGGTEDWPPNILAADDCKGLESPPFMYANAILISPRSRTPVYNSSGVLRNLTKKIYVRAGGLPDTDIDTGYELFMFEEPPPIDSAPGLGSVLLSRVGWSEDSSCNMGWDKADSLTEGESAGDRFDVRALDDVKEELETDGWIDATDEEAERMTGLWASDFY